MGYKSKKCILSELKVPLKYLLPSVKNLKSYLHPRYSIVQYFATNVNPFDFFPGRRRSQKRLKNNNNNKFIVHLFKSHKANYMETVFVFCFPIFFRSLPLIKKLPMRKIIIKNKPRTVACSKGFISFSLAPLARQKLNVPEKINKIEEQQQQKIQEKWAENLAES